MAFVVVVKRVDTFVNPEKIVNILENEYNISIEFIKYYEKRKINNIKNTYTLRIKFRSFYRDQENVSRFYDELLKYEGELISKELKDNCIFYCFDKKGSKFSSEEFSELIFSQNQIINFIIGGAYGICEKIKMKASKIISFSDMEFSHEIFRLMILEQIYRAKCIYTNHPYHQN